MVTGIYNIDDDFDFAVGVSDAANQSTVSVTTTGTSISSGNGTWFSKTSGTGPGNISSNALGMSPNHPGIWRITSGATTNDTISLYKGRSINSTNSYLAPSKIKMYRAVVRWNAVTTFRSSFGVGSSIESSANAGGGESIVFHMNTSLTNPTLLKCICRTNNVQETLVDTDIAPTAGQWLDLVITQETAGTAKFYVNDVLKATINTFVPDDATNITLNVGGALQTLTSASRNLDIDLIQLVVGGIDRTSQT